MKRGLKKLLSFLPECVQEFLGMIFDGSAEHHIKMAKLGKQKYRSYTQLKRRQKNIRRALTLILLMITSGFAGILMGPIFFPQPAESEVYIPNGKGDILVSNVSRSQATVIFKTLDGANGNLPLATKSVVEFYEDPQYTDLARRITENEYAITHIVAADSLQEGKIYYIKITAQDAATPAHSKIVTTWGELEPIEVFTTGELIPTCANNQINSKEENNTEIQNEVKIAAKNISVDDKGNDSVLQISGVMNENHLQPGNKVQTIISWSTNLPATAKIIYGEDRVGEKKELAVSEEFELRHAAILTTLKPATVYYFRVQSTDANGNKKESEEYSLRTPRPQENIIQKIKNNFKGLLLQIKPR